MNKLDKVVGYVDYYFEDGKIFIKKYVEEG